MKIINFENTFKDFESKIDNKNILSLQGKVTRIIGITIESTGPDASLGELCSIKLKNGTEALAEVVGFYDNKTLLMPFEDVQGLYVGAPVRKNDSKVSVCVGEELLGKVLDGLGRSIEGMKIKSEKTTSIYKSPPNPLIKKKIEEPLSVGVKAIDGMISLGKGQRISIMAGSGVGKSTLLGMIAKNTEAEINVIGLIGERGREVREFIERDLGPEGLKKSIIVVSTSDQPALMRVKALLTATTIAEYFRDSGKNVLLMVDSLTRWAMAQREIGLSVGEPPTTKGYTPSVFSDLPKILERAGNSDTGFLTAIYTVLVEADDMNDPIADTVRGIVDGHIVLSRKMADSAHYPAIDVLQSVSRLMPAVVSKEHMEAYRTVKDIYATYREAKDLIDVGAYKSGSNKKIDTSIKEIDNINNFLKQRVEEAFEFIYSSKELINISNRCK